MAALPVKDSVSNYEKISRIGEGTYGVVCECFFRLSTPDEILQVVPFFSKGTSNDDAVHHMVQTKPEIERPERLSRSKKCAWSAREMVQ